MPLRMPSAVKTARARWLGVGLLFLLISWLHMGPSLTQCTSVVLSNPGDHTAGIMYSNWVHPNSPLPGTTSLTNYPYGEDLWQPLALTSVVPTSLHLILSHLTNLVCGWNLLVLIGYLTSALSMYAFMYWLTKNSWVAFFAGYAVTLTPYHAFASHGQIAGLLNAVFILALWQYLRLWQKPTWWRAAGLGVILGLSFYTDGYFILISGVLLASMWLTTLSVGALFLRKRAVAIRQQVLCLGQASAIATVSVLPLVWLNHRYAAQIQSIFGNARGDILTDAQIYSAKLPMYLNRHSLVFLGFSVVALACLGAWYTWGKRPDSKQTKSSPLNRLFLAGATALIVSLVALWVSLQPTTQILGLTIYNPSHFIIMLTSSWRVFGRLYMTVSIGVVTLAGIGLLWLWRRAGSYKYIMYVALFLVMALELRSFPATANTPVFDYRKAPLVYTWLQENPAVRAVAEYPLDEPPQGAYLGDYLTFQEISGKPLLNTLLPNSAQAGLRRSIAGINDPQTIPVLRALGIDLVNVRPYNPESNLPDTRQAAASNKQLVPLFSDTSSKHWVDSFLIKPGVVARYALTIPSVQYFQLHYNEDGTVTYMLDDDTILSVIALPSVVEPSEQLTIAFVVRADSDRQATIVQDGQELWVGLLRTDPQTITLTVSPDSPITVRNQRTDQPTHIDFSKLQVLN